MAGALVRKLAQGMQRLRVKDICKPVHGIVRVGYVKEHRRLFPAQFLDVDSLRVGKNPHRVTERERRQLGSKEAEDAGGSLFGAFRDGLEQPVAGERETPRVHHFQLPHKGLVSPVPAHLPGKPHHAPQMALPLRQRLEDVADGGFQVNPCGQLPVGVMPALNRHHAGGKGQDILLPVMPLPVLSDTGKGVVAAGG